MSQSTNLIFNGGSIPGTRVQSDWNETNPQAESFIKHKPDIDNGRIHRLRPARDEIIGETSNYDGWVLDLESPNESAPGGYDRLTPQRLKQILDDGEFLVLETYQSGTYVPLALQSLVTVQNENPLQISVDFVRQYESYNLLGFERMQIYTPSGEESYLQIRGLGPRSSWWQDKEALAINGNGKDVTVTFNAASTVANIASGEELSVTLGKIAKWFSAGFPIKNYGTVNITSQFVFVTNNGYTKIVNPSGSQEGTVQVRIDTVTAGEIANVELDIDNSASSIDLTVTVKILAGSTYVEIPSMVEGTLTATAGKILHVSAHGMGWLGTMLS